MDDSLFDAPDDNGRLNIGGNGHVALFIDWENIKYSLKERGEEPDLRALLQAATRYGRLQTARAYADWVDYEHRRTLDPAHLYRAGIEPVYVLCRRQTPFGWERVANAVDVKLTADVLETCFTRADVTTFVLVTGDQSVMHLISPLRTRDKTLIVIGVEGNTAEYIGERVDRLIYYHDLLGDASFRPPAAPPADLETVLRTMVELLREQRAAARGGYSNLAGLGGQMSQRLPGFRAADYGFERFGDLVRHAEQQGLVQLAAQGPRTYVLLPGEELPPPGEAQSQEAAYGPSEAPAGANADLDTAVQTLATLVRERRAEGNLPLFAWLGVAFSQRLPGFSLFAHGFLKFGDLARHAERQGAIQIVTRGTHYLALPPGDPLLDVYADDANAVASDSDAAAAPDPQTAAARTNAVFTDLARTLDELEARYPYVTARKLAQSVWNKAHRDPAALPPGVAPVSDVTRAFAEQDLAAFAQAATDNGLFHRGQYASPGSWQPLATIRLNRSHPLVARFVENGPAAPPLAPDLEPALREPEEISHEADAPLSNLLDDEAAPPASP